MAGLASLLSRRTTNPRAGGAARRRELLRRKYQHQVPTPMWDGQGNPWPSGHGGTAPPVRIGGPPGGKHGGLLGYRNGGRTMNPRAAAAAMRRNRPTPATAAERLAMAPIPIPNPGGWYAGGDVDVDSREALMAEKEMLQQQLQMADEVTAREIMAQIMEINKELEMAAVTGMAGGGIASLRGGGAPWSRGNPRVRPIRQQAPQAPMGPPARLSRPGWGSPGLDIPGGG